MSMGADMPNTDINMKDHDLLIASYTLQQEMIRRLDTYIESNDKRHQQTTADLNETRRNQTKIEGEMGSIKGMISNLDEKVDGVESISKWLSIAAILGTIIAGAISILVYVR